MSADIPTVPFSDFLDQANTGDVVLWTGTSLISLAVEIATFSVFSHASMVIRDPKSDTLYLFQSVSESLAPDPLSKMQITKHDGVQAGPLQDVMKIVYNFKDYPTWAQLDWPSRPKDFDQTVWDLARGMDGTPFPVVADDDPIKSEEKTIELLLELLAKGRVEGKEILSPIFCSGLVACMLQGAGVIQPSMPPNGYEPRDFSSQYPGPTKLEPGVAFKPDAFVDMSSVTTA